MTTERERVLCITLTQQEWQAFISRCPQPVEWLRQQILEQISSQAPADAAHARMENLGGGFAAQS